MDATIKDLLDAGAHFGHQSRYWNPKMKSYIYTTYNRINIINLEHTLTGLRRACEFVHDLAKNRNKLLFVGTKKAAGDTIKEHAIDIGQYYVNHRWMGGTLTNYNIICASIDKLRDLQQQKAAGMFYKLTKKEAMMRQRTINKLERSIGGIKDMNGLPDALFVVDVRHEHIAIAEAKKLGIPVIGIVDTNSNPDNIDYVIPGNDDSIRSIRLFVTAITSSFSEGEQLAEQFSMMRSNKKEQAKTKDGERLTGTLSKLNNPTNSKDTEEKKEQVAASNSKDNIQTTEKSNSNSNEDEQSARDQNISAKAVKELREISGAGIMDCKSALKEANGDINQAADILRQSGITKQLKRANRATSEGTIAFEIGDEKAIVVTINCETDFVARNEDFIGFAQEIAQTFYKNPPEINKEEIILSDGLDKKLQTIAQKMGENIQITEYRELSVPENGSIAAYLHTNNKICALVSIDTEESKLARDIAMQVAAMSPLAATPDDISQEILDKEKDIFIAQMQDEDKADDIKEKMLAGKLKKFSEQVSLSEQSFIKNPEQKVGSLLKDAGVKDVKFIRLAIGQE